MLPFAFICFFISVIIIIIIVILGQKSQKSNLPPSPPRLPLIGNLHQVGLLTQQSLHVLSRKHGDLMLLHLGCVQTLVVSSPEGAEEILKKQDDVFASRPSTKAWNLLLYGSRNVGFAPYGKYWKQAKKLYVIHLLAPTKVKSFDQAREEEVSKAIEKIRLAHELSNPIDLCEVLSSFTLDVICRIVSKSFSKRHLLRELIEEGTTMFSEFNNFEDYFPTLRCLDMLTGFNSKAIKIFKQWDELLDEVIKEHMNRHLNGEKDEDLLDVLLTLEATNKDDFELTKDHLKAILIEMFAGGSHTTFITIEWAMAELVQNRKVMKKLQQEFRKIRNAKQILTIKDIKEITYLTCVIKETLRLHPPAPLLVPRESMQESNVKGYRIPKGTKVVINAWTINRDPNYWENPNEFYPERFMENTVDFRGNNLEYLPFGAGKRICPGINFAQSNIEIILANILYHFDWELPHGEELDMSEAAGLSARRAENLRLIPQKKDR